MGALGEIYGIITDQIRRSNVSDISNDMESGKITPWEVPQKLADATGDPQYAQIASDQKKIQQAYGQIQPSGNPLRDIMNVNSLLLQSGDASAMKRTAEFVPMLAQLGKTLAETDAARSTIEKNNFEMGGAGTVKAPVSPLAAFAMPSAVPQASEGGASVPPVTASQLNGAPSGGTPLPPSPDQMPPQGEALATYRQENGMPTPPVDNERASMGLPIGSSTPGLSPKAALEASTVGAKKQAENVIDVKKGVDTMMSNIPGVREKLKGMRDTADQTLSGYGVTPDEGSSDATGWKGMLTAQLNPNDPRYAATLKFKTLNDQLFVNELPTMMNAASGMRMDVPIVKGVKGASGVPLEAPGSAKREVIDSLEQNVNTMRDKALDYYKKQTGRDYYNTPESIRAAYQQGIFNKSEAAELLRKNHRQFQ